jgi:hypothetical protein
MGIGRVASCAASGHPAGRRIAAALAAALRGTAGTGHGALILSPIRLAEGVWWDPPTGVRTDPPRGAADGATHG